MKTVTLADLRRRPRYVARLAMRRGGVSVVDEHGAHRFRLIIPSTRIQ